jgi:hypothetical protein
MVIEGHDRTGNSMDMDMVYPECTEHVDALGTDTEPCSGIAEKRSLLVFQERLVAQVN